MFPILFRIFICKLLAILQDASPKTLTPPKYTHLQQIVTVVSFEHFHQRHVHIKRLQRHPHHGGEKCVMQEDCHSYTQGWWSFKVRHQRAADEEEIDQQESADEIEKDFGAFVSSSGSVGKCWRFISQILLVLLLPNP